MRAFSMRSLGTELGVEAMTLYHYFPSKDALLDAVVDRFSAQIDVSPAHDWEGVARAFARAFRAAAHAAPATARLLLQRPPPPTALAKARSAVDHLVDGGLDPTIARLA